MSSDSDWDQPHPFTMKFAASEADCDRLGHVNNATYLRWMEATSWAHIEPLGMDWATHEETGRAMAIVRTEIDYLASAYAGDEIMVGTWITTSDGKLTSERAFQIQRVADGKTLSRALCRYACIDLQSGRPKRMPEQFRLAHEHAMAVHAGNHRKERN
ncbi:acyl-CoA thioesterase [Allohahella sp. A8]|mgnify:CR=1 FL=1|uniref:acyl-CoA thioesterase n=1 Tax=Allohahella sp. A8 TaxID=3141461 RepID=UPI0026985488|tara:strand:- start:28671 stop:29144 length:474 start_codon:yes stop_codon:yes gene_type:complete